MTGTWADESALEYASEVLAERYPGEVITIIETFDIAWVGWECDYRGAFIRHGDLFEIVIIDETGGDDRPALVKVLDQMLEYARLLGATQGVLDRYRAAGGRMPDEMPADVADAIEKKIGGGE